MDFVLRLVLWGTAARTGARDDPKGFGAMQPTVEGPYSSKRKVRMQGRFAQAEASRGCARGCFAGPGRRRAGHDGYVLTAPEQLEHRQHFHRMMDGAQAPGGGEGAG